MRVIIGGGGIGGPGATIALGRPGHQVVVLERKARLDSAGAGITLFANAMRALDRLGVGDAVRARGAPAEQRERGFRSSHHCCIVADRGVSLRLPLRLAADPEQKCRSHRIGPLL
jgi:2-polyprenyl-6-methoxyphenol hydroxylase-like FAD-dependent oxidoreductase